MLFCGLDKVKSEVSFLHREFCHMQKKVEMAGKHLCSVVYGSLPPETRTKQVMCLHLVFPSIDIYLIVNHV
jgi:ATP-dependent RNA helicase SUPV3L1/SUV3